MAEQLQLRKGSSSQVASNTPVLAEPWFDTTHNRLVMGDGSTPGGWPLAKLAEVSQLSILTRGVNLNVTGDNYVSVALPTGITRFRIKEVIVANASSAPGSSARLGLYTGAGQTGVTVASQQALNAITSAAANTAGNSIVMTLNNATTTTFNVATLYINVGTINNSALTADVLIVIQPIS